ncbi:hypothetical protein [Mesorhizobium sp. BR1-1-6]|uniref:DUF768 domain-containing protein n=2 Tax=Mesorhizobium TaxID=68287 RepID=UPI00398D4FAE
MAERQGHFDSGLSGCGWGLRAVHLVVVLSMSTRGTNFLHKWISSNVPETVGADVSSVAQLTQKLFSDAKAAGISSTEIEEDTVSLYNAILDAIVHHEAGMAD